MFTNAFKLILRDQSFVCGYAQSQASFLNKLLLDMRKRTGYSFFKCKQALIKFDYDSEKSEMWLHEQARDEGWTNAQKVNSRLTKEGLIGVQCDGNFASIVHVGCETDFVSRNDVFKKFVSSVAQSTLDFRKSTVKENLRLASSSHATPHVREVVLQRHIDSDVILAEELRAVVGAFRENIKIKRAVGLSTSETNVVGVSVHGNIAERVGGCWIGAYGAFVVLAGKGSQLRTLADGIAGHVIGMNPRGVESTDGINEEESLLNQEYLMDNTKLVSEVLEKENAKVVDFMRFSVHDDLSS